MLEVKASLSRYQHDLTRKQYILNTKYFIKYCREQHDCRTFEECQQYIEEYINFLINKGLSACTIHTYAAAISATYQIPLNSISKPRRIIGEFTRGRNEIQYPHSSQDLENPAYQRLIEFAEKTGIRRAEYAKLKGCDWVYDESGNRCIFVRCGKLGKPQKQLVRKNDIPYFENFFAEIPDDEYVFSKQEMNNHLNLHKFRSDNAKRWYLELEEKLKQDPSYAYVMIQHIKSRFENSINPKTGKPKIFNPKSVEGFYYLRGSLRQKCMSENRPIKYNKLIVMYISVHVLAHYRCNVCIQNYLL